MESASEETRLHREQLQDRVWPQVGGLAAKAIHDFHGSSEGAEGIDFQGVEGFEAGDPTVGIIWEPRRGLPGNGRVMRLE